MSDKMNIKENNEESKWVKKMNKHLNIFKDYISKSSTVDKSILQQFEKDLMRDTKTLQKMLNKWKNGCPNCSQTGEFKNDVFTIAGEEYLIFFICPRCYYQEGFR